MKTNTKENILAYIKEKGKVTAGDIIRFSGFTAAAIFRQLKKLREEEKIIKIGSVPRVFYRVRANLPKAQSNSVIHYQHMNAWLWAAAASPADPPPEFYCPATDVWQGRFSRLAPTLIKSGFDESTAALMASAIGEIGDNCFAHNAPNWIDVRGCWFEYAIHDGKFHCVVADRGRGILNSLKAVRPDLQSHQEALFTALTERVTGRAPEQRGNGLKYTTNVLARLAGGGFRLQTGNACFECALPLDQPKILQYIKQSEQSIRGTFCEINLTVP